MAVIANGDEQPVPAGEAAARPRLRARARRLGLRAGWVLLVAMAAYYALALVLLGVYRFADPPITGLQLQRRVEAMLSRRDYKEVKVFVPYSRIPASVRHAVVAAEDGRFWSHWGFDFVEMRKASAVIMDGELPRGASTITQQLVKNLFGCACRNPVRKVYDWTLAVPAEILLGKERILELYLNNVEWGNGIFGIEAGARHHYGVGARSLTRTQAAGLAALLPNPLRRTPASTTWYRTEILRRMTRNGW